MMSLSSNILSIIISDDKDDNDDDTSGKKSYDHRAYVLLYK